MTGEKFYRSFLRIHLHEWEGAMQLLNDGQCFAVLVPFGGPDQLRLLGSLIKSSLPYFMVIPTSEIILGSQQLRQLCLCLSSRNYFAIKGNPVIGFLQNNQSPPEQMRVHIDAIEREVLEQKWPAVHAWHIYPDAILGNEPVPTLVSKPMTFSDTSGHFHFGDTLDGDLFFDGESLRESLDLDDSFAEKVAEAFPNTKLLQRMYQLKMKTEAEVVSGKNLQEKLKNAEEMIVVTRDKYKSDYEGVIKWYQHEYEILPLWYKRFGQVLKVMTGKRHWRSLFDKSVKKYKS